MKFKTFLIASLLLGIATTISAQNYKTGIGARIGFPNGITVKHFISPYNAIEAIVNFRWDGVIVTGLHEWQERIPCAPGLDYVLGVGAHIGLFNNYKWNPDKTFIMGVDVMLGVEYAFPTVPFSLGLDYKPAINFIGDNHIWADGLGLNFRFNIR